METVVSTSQLYKACHVLFGTEVDLSVDFLRYLKIPGLKAVYRKKALETHPDRAVALDRPPVDLEEQFKVVNAAYQELHRYLENPTQFKLIEEPSAKARPRAKAPARKTNAAAEGFMRQFFKGTVPKRELLFGQYVYYDGCISYRQLIDAIIWQKIQRPLVGNIAVHWKWLDEEEVSQILQGRLWGEKFGETALRGGYLTSVEIRTILKRQKFLQPRIGKYFVEKKILPAALVEKMAEELRRHNRLYRSR